jgi:tetratricopeptide (TPR) repeat protein
MALHQPGIQQTGHLLEGSAMRDRLLPIITLRSVHWLMFIVIGVALYGFTLHYPFIFDDRMYVMGNPLLTYPGHFRDLLDLDEFMSNHLNQLTSPDLATSFALRPMAYLTFRLNYLLSGNNPASYRVFNIGVHISNAIMLYQMLRSIIRRRGNESEIFSNVTIPLFAALIFLVHPLQTQSVTYITQRFASLGTFFYLATMLLYIRSSDEGAASVRRWAYTGSIVALILGMLTRESILTVPIALVMVDIILLRIPLRGTLIRLAPHIACMSLVPLLVLNIAKEVRETNPLISSATDIVGGDYSRAEYAITQLRTILSYLRLFVLPYNQNFDPDYPLYRSLLHPEIIISILIWGTIIYAGVHLLRQRDRGICTDLTVFSIIWFPLAISVSSSFIPLSDLMFEHRTYLPSLAFCTGSVAYLHHVMSRGSVFQRNAIIGGLCLAVLVFGVLTVQRNQTYSSRLSIWSDTVKKSPNKSRPHFALGAIYHESQLYDQAILCFEKSLALNPDYIEPYISLGSLYLDLGMPQDTIELYETYLTTHSPSLNILKNLALAYVKSDMLQEAIATMRLVLNIADKDVQLLGFFAELNLRAGNIQEAKLYLAKAREADKNDTTVDMSTSLDLLEKLI